MIENFEEITFGLTDEEKKLIPILVKGFSAHTQKDPIKAPDIIKKINDNLPYFGLKKKFSEPRLRKICNFIRSNSIIPLIATSDGYFVSYEAEVIQSQIISLSERADAIYNTVNGLKKFLKQ